MTNRITQRNCVHGGYNGHLNYLIRQRQPDGRVITQCVDCGDAWQSDGKGGYTALQVPDEPEALTVIETLALVNSYAAQPGIDQPPLTEQDIREALKR